jgi:hypothetical protein
MPNPHRRRDGSERFTPSASHAELEKERSAAPWDLYGCQLPPLWPGEVELARVQESGTVLCEAVSVRVRRVARGFAYRVVDEHGRRWKCRPATSLRPLTSARLAELITTAECLDEFDEAGDPVGIFTPLFWLLQDDEPEGDGRRDELVGRYRVLSPAHPAIESHFRKLLAEWPTY